MTIFSLCFAQLAQCYQKAFRAFSKAKKKKMYYILEVKCQ